MDPAHSVAILAGLVQYERKNKMTQERKTASMLQRVPVILAVTAASYGLQLPPQVARPGGATASSTRVASLPTPASPAAAPRLKQQA